MQKVVTIYTSVKKNTREEDGLEEINTLLSEGWHIVSVTPMGGAAMTLQQKDLSSYAENISFMLLGSVVVLSDDKNSICSI